MKLIYLSHWRFPSEKSLTPFVLRTCAHFVKLGYEVELWVPRRHNDHPQTDMFDLYKVSPRFPVRYIKVIDLMRYLGTIGFLIMVATYNLSVYWRLRKEQKVIIYSPDIRDVILPSLRGSHIFVEIHDFYESSVRFINRFVFSRVKGLIVTNTLKIKYLAEKYGIPQEKMLHQPNAVDAKGFDILETKAEARAKLNLPQNPRIVMYGGHLYWWKGVRTLADASSFIPEETIIYFVGGTVEDRRALEDYVKKNALPRIAFIPNQPLGVVPLWLRAADVLVLPNTALSTASRLETSPLKLLDYMAAEKPIVASDLPSIRDIVSEREVFFAEPDNPKDFAKIIVEVLSNKEEASKRAELAKIAVGRRTWEARAQAIQAFMQKLADI
jgi:glycosyltransferase involved in cell wall biosynthesis